MKMRGGQRLAMLVLAAALSGYACVAPRDAAIPLFSDALARRLGPTRAPFIVTYGSGETMLTFVGADHVFTDENSTIDAVRRAFDAAEPAAVIVEGFPTALGPSPAVIVESIRRRAAPDADGYSRSEGAFTASLAIARSVPFFGGEPTVDEEIAGLVAHGHPRDDVLFALVLRSLGQARRSGALPVGDAATFAHRFGDESRAVAAMSGSPPLTLSGFQADYRRLIGTDPVADADMPTRYDPGTRTPLNRMGADNMRVRDEHLLSTIRQQLDRYGRVLVVYGSSHWTTLARALRARLGEPSIEVLPAGQPVSGS